MDGHFEIISSLNLQKLFLQKLDPTQSPSSSTLLPCTVFHFFPSFAFSSTKMVRKCDPNQWHWFRCISQTFNTAVRQCRPVLLNPQHCSVPVSISVDFLAALTLTLPVSALHWRCLCGGGTHRRDFMLHDFGVQSF